MKKENIFIVGIAGGTGSGKTKAAKNLFSKFDENDIAIIEQDVYYKDLKHLTFDEREKNNFDHPNAIDFELMYDNITELINSSKVSIPMYDYKTHIRKTETQLIQNKRIVIIEGIFALLDERIREIMNLKIYVDTNPDIRIIRRIKRDINKRGRKLNSIIEQYYSFVRPMHKKFVKPTKEHADIILNGGGKNQIAINMIRDNIKNSLKIK